MCKCIQTAQTDTHVHTSTYIRTHKHTNARPCSSIHTCAGMHAIDRCLTERLKCCVHSFLNIMPMVMLHTTLHTLHGMDFIRSD